MQKLYANFSIIDLSIYRGNSETIIPKQLYLDHSSISKKQTRIKKQIQAAIINDANWNTDFAVPTGKTFKYYVGDMVPETYFCAIPNSLVIQITAYLKQENLDSSQLH